MPAVLDEGDCTVYEKRLPNDLATIIDVLGTYQAELAGCVELVLAGGLPDESGLSSSPGPHRCHAPIGGAEVHQ